MTGMTLRNYFLHGNFLQKDLRSIEGVIHGSAVSEAKHDITELKEKVQERTEVWALVYCLVFLHKLQIRSYCSIWTWVL